MSDTLQEVTSEPAALGVMLRFPVRRVADLMVGAIEGNSMTRAWCNGVFWHTRAEDPPERLGPQWYDNPGTYVEPGFFMTVEEVVDESKEPVGANVAHHRVDAEGIVRGLELMSRIAGRHFGDVLDLNDDNVTQDVFLQCVALGEVRYG